MVNCTQISDLDRQTNCPCEFLSVIQEKATDDEIALCRWEDDGGAIGREESDA